MPQAPRAPRRPTTLTQHGDVRVDPYYWLRERDDEGVLAHLRAENDYQREQMAPLTDLEETLYQEIKSRIEETDISVPVRRGAWWYFERTREGLSYAIHCRVPAVGTDPTPPPVEPNSTREGEQVLLDENAESDGHDFFSLGIFDVSLDDRWVALGTDLDGAERFTVTVRPLAGQAPVDDLLEDVYYGFTWANDSRHFFYTRVDDAMRPWQVWRHELGTSVDADALVYQEDDEKYSLGVGRSRDDAVIVVASGSSMTTELHYLPADDPTAALAVVEPRRLGVEYSLEHYSDARGDGWWLMITNEGATDFRLLARRVTGGDWKQILAERRGERLDGVDAFAGFLAISERHDASTALRLVDLLDGDDPFGDDLFERSRLVDAGERPATMGLSTNLDFVTTHLRIAMTSMVTPPLVADVVVATGEWIVRKRRTVHNYDASLYATGRLWVSASDGERIPVSVVARRDLVAIDDDGELSPIGPTPMLLGGYGSYEISTEPVFSAARLSLLDRGIVVALAHVRGGGEMGRTWYEMGRLAQKPTTFSDFVAVARGLVARGWTTPEHLAARGGSAGGLLMGAVINLAPDLFRCVVAEVPFVDVVTTMSDPSLPLTAAEWEEWGDPITSATAYRTMKSYSPYDNVSSTNADGSPRRYPDLYVEGGLNDSRVGFWEPAKWVQALREANPENVVYLRTDLGVGHAGPSGRYDAWRDEARVLSFVVSEIIPT